MDDDLDAIADATSLRVNARNVNSKALQKTVKMNRKMAKWKAELNASRVKRSVPSLPKLKCLADEGAS